MSRKICFTGGGTAGHVFPGISVIESLCSRNNYKKEDFIWIGSKSGMERKLVEEAGIEFKGILSGKLRRYFSLQNFVDIFKITLGIVQAFCILFKVHPQIIFSKGGYVSVPPVLAGKLLGIPVITHESDYTPGLATKINANFSRKILLSVEETRKYLKPKFHDKCVVVGNPVRSQFYNGDAQKGLAFLGFDTRKPLIFVVGGSQGSGEINQLIWEIRKPLAEKYYIAHQVGANSIIGKPDVPGYVQIPFIKEEMADVIAASSLVVTRAGAGSLWELSAVGRAALLIPLRGSGTRGDQVKNALYFKEQNAAAVLMEDTIKSQDLLAEIESIVGTERGRELSVKMAQMAKKDSADSIAYQIVTLIGKD
ncbi:MAG: undecaprenyldiphospho-muramoylpentapeptide beta-N-acetylglucosaminyltransferase [Spirochaetia bacterium]|nr:undecaprenyldiphospho-muramoylpentapeptide beta-N-acetylglucosaminyltransferase [Spirochaetia bacterium]